eukprot:CAMPEP_0115295044 /NCGR_PEP_ID=MMETSP0270-20121206/66500_1 /TAXON_ID=71861 /ORGANISM="Scrippsiella trochoidea, Strain CCMP3099" /LENGTH=413 /DNA_ID=CAMNT_0002712599 /DNA_START=10 /DNA_END=1249 /DNA_ORIENTATION=+
MAEPAALHATVPLAPSTATLAGPCCSAVPSRAGAVIVVVKPDLSEAWREGHWRGGLGVVLSTAAALGIVATTRARPQRRGLRVLRRGFRDGSESRQLLDLSEDVDAPQTLYQLLGVSRNAGKEDIKKAYYKMQKICHPDIAGPEAEEMCILLNDAYETLSDPEGRDTYDESLALTSTQPVEEKVEIKTDLLPTWKWRPKKHKQPPVWTGEPKSRSLWERVPLEERGHKHQAQKFIYVDEFSCISCRNCCDVAPHTFCIDAEYGRARVYSQWGNGEEWLDYAVSSCPVDCIHWVGRDELQVLEHTTQRRLYDSNGQLPCPMSIRQGFIEQENDAFGMAMEFKAKQEAKEAQRKKKLRYLEAGADKFTQRIREVIAQMSASLRAAIFMKRKLEVAAAWEVYIAQTRGRGRGSGHV